MNCCLIVWNENCLIYDKINLDGIRPENAFEIGFSLHLLS